MGSARRLAVAVAVAAVPALAGAAALTATGCPHPHADSVPPPASGLAPGAPLDAVVAHLARGRTALRTLRAVHHVVLHVEDTVFDMNGFLAVSYPDRFRLRATAFGGVTLFDLLHVGGDTRVLAVREEIASKGPVALLWPELGRDLALALGLGALPAYERLEVPAPGDRWVLHAPGVETTLSRPGGLVLREERRLADGRCARFVDFRAHAVISGVVVAKEAALENFVTPYRADVEVTKVEPNATLDPRLFP